MSQFTAASKWQDDDEVFRQKSLTTCYRYGGEIRIMVEMT